MRSRQVHGAIEPICFRHCIHQAGDEKITCLEYEHHPERLWQVEEVASQYEAHKKPTGDRVPAPPGFLHDDRIAWIRREKNLQQVVRCAWRVEAGHRVQASAAHPIVLMLYSIGQIL